MDSLRRKKVNISLQNFDRYSENYKPERNYESNPKPKKIHSLFWLKILIISLSAVVSTFIVWGSYFSWKLYAVSKKVSIKSEESSSSTKISSLILPIVSEKRTSLSGEEEGRINILLLGSGGGNHPGKNLTDTIMIMSLDMKNKKVALMSLPRDLYVSIPDTTYSTRINSVYQYGLSNDEGIGPIEKTIEKITGLEINYFLVMDFDGFEKIINDIGGVNVIVERDIYDSRYPGPNYSYETFEIKKGVHNMDGTTALKYVRERHDDPEGDFGRAKRQQQVLQAAKNKIFSLGTFVNPLTLNNVLNELEKNIKTDAGLEEIESFMKLSDKFDTQNITNVVVDAWKKDSLLKVSHVNLGNSRAFILVPRVGNYSEVQDLARNIFNLDEIRKRQSEIEKEDARIVLINQSSDKELASKIKTLLQDKLGIKNVRISATSGTAQLQGTLAYDKTSGQKLFTLDEIIKKLPARLSDKNDDIISLKEGADIVVLLGNDAARTYSFEEDSIEDLNNANDSQEYMEIMNQN